MVDEPSSSKERYEKIKHLGEGQFANVYKAKDTVTNEVVAIKKIKIGSRSEAKDGVNRTALREIKLLQELQHEHITELKDVIGHKTNIQLVFEFMESDLEHMIKNQSILLMPSHIKNITVQMLLGLDFLHAHWILHRDLKPNNLLVNDKGRVKLADFGLARFYGSPNRESDLDQMVKICDVLGTPSDELWPGMALLPDYIKLKPIEGLSLSYVFPAAGHDLLQFLTWCWQFDPLKRCTCTQALKHTPYFTNEPYPCDDGQLPLPSRQAATKGAFKRRRDESANEDKGPPSSKKRLAF